MAGALGRYCLTTTQFTSCASTLIKLTTSRLITVKLLKVCSKKVTLCVTMSAT